MINYNEPYLWLLFFFINVFVIYKIYKVCHQSSDNSFEEMV